MLVEWTWTGKSLPSKKNSKRIIVNRVTLKPILLPSEEYVEWENRFVLDIKSLGYKIGRWKSAVFTFYAPNRARWDLSNKQESINDALVKAGYIHDDDVSHVPDTRTVFGGISPEKEWRVVAEIETK